jgi:hypothetical protein
MDNVNKIYFFLIPLQLRDEYLLVQNKAVQLIKTYHENTHADFAAIHPLHFGNSCNIFPIHKFKITEASICLRL